MIEAGVPGYEVTTFNGLVAPAGTPEPIIGLLNAVINEGLRTREIQASIRNLGAVSDPVSPAQFGAFIAAERRKWSMVAKEASVHID
jgi:tripartite-type tricarboxylate transporter receptor subunit TctC